MSICCLEILDLKIEAFQRSPELFHICFENLKFQNLFQYFFEILKFPKCLGLPAHWIFEMLTYVEGFQLSNSAFDAHLGEALKKYGFSVCPNDSQLYSISGPDGQFLAAVKTVDNFMIASNSSALTEYLYEAVRSAGYTILQEAKGSQISLF